MKKKLIKAIYVIAIAAAVVFVAVYAYTVIRDTLDSNIKITVEEPFTVAELYVIMQRDGQFELPYALSNESALDYIVFPQDHRLSRGKLIVHCELCIVN